MRLIDADMLEPTEVYMNYGFTRIVYMDDIDEMPTVDTAKHGHWVKSLDHYDRYMCSVCGHLTNTESDNYCSYCGAKMDEVKDETN